jgi:putative transcriptional regulator
MAEITANMQKALGERVRELREQRNWTQRELADACGMDHNLLGSIERGQCNPTVTTLLKIANQFDTTLAALFDGLG